VVDGPALSHAAVAVKAFCAIAAAGRLAKNGKKNNAITRSVW
jgi:hypothetical protein